MSLIIDQLRLVRGGRMLLKSLSAAPTPGSMTLIAGPNGVGKSTLLDTLAGDVAPDGGRVSIGGRSIHCLPLAARARCRAFLPQRVALAFAFPVRDVVAMGLAPFGLSPTSAEGRAILKAAMADADVSRFAARATTQLSGGEQQRVHIARTLAQVEAARLSGIAHPLLLLDEPLTGLDYAHQFALMRRFAQAAQDGATVLLSLHDLALGAAYADWLLLLGTDQPPAFAQPAALMNAETIANVFSLSSQEARQVLAAAAPIDRAQAIAAE